LLIGLHKTVNLIVPDATGAVAIVKIMSSVTIFSATTVETSTLASGVASCHISFKPMAVPVVCAISPAVVFAVPTSSVAEAPARFTSQTAIIFTATIPVTLNNVYAPAVPATLPVPNLILA